MAKRDLTNEEVLNQISNPDALPEFAGFEEEQLSFPPYWEASEGGWFYGMPVDVDTRDPQFGRYLIQAEMDIKCKTGKKDEQEEILVRKGEFFTLSMYGLLPLDRYIGTKVLVKCIGKKDVGQPQKAWNFSLKVSPEDKKKLIEDRKAIAAEAVRRFREARKNPQLTTGKPSTGAEVPFD